MRSKRFSKCCVCSRAYVQKMFESTSALFCESDRVYAVHKVEVNFTRNICKTIASFFYKLQNVDMDECKLCIFKLTTMNAFYATIASLHTVPLRPTNVVAQRLSPALR